MRIDTSILTVAYREKAVPDIKKTKHLCSFDIARYFDFLSSCQDISFNNVDTRQKPLILIIVGAR